MAPFGLLWAQDCGWGEKPWKASEKALQPLGPVRASWHLELCGAGARGLLRASTRPASPPFLIDAFLSGEASSLWEAGEGWGVAQQAEFRAPQHHLNGVWGGGPVIPDRPPRERQEELVRSGLRYAGPCLK